MGCAGRRALPPPAAACVCPWKARPACNLSSLLDSVVLSLSSQPLTMSSEDSKVDTFSGHLGSSPALRKAMADFAAGTLGGIAGKIVECVHLAYFAHLLCSNRQVTCFAS
jgi:hypothetical protein